MSAISGDLCPLVEHPDGKTYPAVEHYRCDDYRDGCVTDPATGEVLKHAVGGQRGFRR